MINLIEILFIYVFAPIDHFGSNAVNFFFFFDYLIEIMIE